MYLQMQLSFIKKRREKKQFKNNLQKLNLKKEKNKRMEKLLKRTMFRSSSKIGLRLGLLKLWSNYKKILKSTQKHGEIETKLRFLSKSMTLS